MASDPKRFAIKRSSVDALSLPPFPESIARRDPKLAAELETWRCQAQNKLEHSISALQLDREAGNISPAVIAYINGVVSVLQADIDGKVNRSGDTMTGQLQVVMPVDGMDAVPLVLLSGSVGPSLILYGVGNPNSNGTQGDFNGQFYSDLTALGSGLFQRKSAGVWV